MAEGPGDLPAWWPHRAASDAVTVGALRWHVQRFGHGHAHRPLALLLHGTGASVHSWRHLAPRLAERFEVLAPDLPGHGHTRTPATQALSLPAVAAAVGDLLDRLQARPRLVIGHSAGAAVGLRLILDGRVDPALAVAINGALLPLEGPLGRLFLPLARLLAANPLVAPAFSGWAAWPGTTRRLLAATGSTIDAMGERCYAHLVRDPRHAAGALRLMASWDLAALADDLPRLRTPLWLLVGTADRTLPPAHADRVRALVLQAQRVDLDGLGHLAHEEDAERVAVAIERAWDAAAPPGQPG